MLLGTHRAEAARRSVSRPVHSFARAGALWMPKGLRALSAMDALVERLELVEGCHDPEIYRCLGFSCAKTPTMASLGGAIIKPTQVPGVQFWFRSDVGVTTGATFTWADQSGLGRNATQSTGGSQPTLTTASAAWNNKDVVTFTRTTPTWLACDAAAAFMAGTDKPCTVLAALASVSIANIRVYASWGKNGAPTDQPCFFLSLGVSNEMGASRWDDAGTGGVPAIVGTSGVLNNTKHVVATVNTGTTCSIFLDGAATNVAGAAFDGGGAANFDRFTIGSKRQTGSSFGFQDEQAELSGFDTALPTAVRRALERGMKARWGTP
jgi:hypothetical protein